MASWQDVQAYARENFHVDEDEAAWFSTVWPTALGREFVLRVHWFEELLGRPRILLRLGLSIHEGIWPERAASVSDRIFIGSLALDDESDYWMHHWFSLGSLDLDDLGLACRAMVRSAEAIEALYGNEDHEDDEDGEDDDAAS